jgi:hypothetical protein
MSKVWPLSEVTWLAINASELPQIVSRWGVVNKLQVSLTRSRFGPCS